MQHSQRQDVNVINRRNELTCADYNRIADLSKSVNFIFFAVLIFISSATAASAAQRYVVRRPVTPPPPANAPETVPEETSDSQGTIHWETDYTAALRSAKESRRNLLVYFDAESAASEHAAACSTFNQTVLQNWNVQSELARYVLLKLPMAELEANPAVQEYYSTEMANHPGLVLSEFENPDAPYYGQTVAILPFWQSVAPTVPEMLKFLTLPAGTLTQRTMIYAVRIHQHQPLGADGIPDPIAVSAATEQAEYQADKGVMGHQNYGGRSSRALEALGGGSPSEICAQSYSSKSLFEGAIGCMRAWRNSSAHWNLVRRQHTYFGFDIRRGKGDAWYATGFFVD
ncbi:MAG: hypothetical protein LBT89_04490 [Planctomycetaceae bacterium]|nr:hypothetical protein [Planctomycetaceae bacterium]